MGGLRPYGLGVRISAVLAGCVMASISMSSASAATSEAEPATTAAAASAGSVTAAVGVPLVTGPVVAPTEAADAATAMALAGRYRSPVEILDERSESTQTFAQPDGTFRLKQSATPQRVRRGGAWVPVDTTVKLADGVVRPAAAVLDVRFSGGGTGPMVTIAKGERTLSLSWPGVLPIPTLAGDTATYAEVLPGVDLKLAAQVDSFSEVLVVKTAAAASNPELARIRLGLAMSGVELQQDADSGFLRAVDPAGEAVFVSDGAQMWDSPEPTPASARVAARAASVDAPTANLGADPAIDPVPGRTEDVAVQLSSGALTLVPVRDMLLDPGTNFPVYIDPGFNGGAEIWTVVSRKNPNTSYWTGNGYRDSMRVGQSWQSAADDDWRTIVKFGVVPLQGTQIIKAAVHVIVEHSANCAPSPLQLWQTQAIAKANPVTWNTTKAKTWKRLAQVQATANKQSCPKGNDEVKFDQKAVKAVFQKVATDKSTSVTFAFRAKSETDDFQWKKLKAGSTYLDVNFNHVPGKPNGLSASPCDSACTSPVITSSKQPSLKMTATDADDGKLRYWFRVYGADKTTLKADSAMSVTGVTSGNARGWTLPKALPDGQYFWRGRACDSYSCGSSSVWNEFKVDSTNPKLPKISSVKYPTTGWNGGVGVAGDFTFSPGSAADGVSEYSYALNGGKAEPIAPGKTGVVTVAIKPKKDMKNVLSVKAIDLAGNLSGVKEYSFQVAPEGNSWYWSLDEGAGTTSASQPVNNRPVTVSGSGVTWSDSAMAESEGSANFAGTGEMTTTSPVLNTTAVAGFTVAAWVRLPAPPAEDGSEEVPDTGDGEGDPDTGDDPDGEEDAPEDPDDTPVVQAPAKNQTAVSGDGLKRSMFRLGYRNDLNVDQDAGGTSDPAWCFTLAAADTATAAETVACTTQYVSPGDWVHLVGVVDPLNSQIRLYVNGTPEFDGVRTVVSGRALWEATKSFAIGRAFNGAAAERWVGGIDEVFAVPRVWTNEEIWQKAVPSEDAAVQ